MSVSVKAVLGKNAVTKRGVLEIECHDGSWKREATRGKKRFRLSASMTLAVGLLDLVLHLPTFADYTDVLKTSREGSQ